MLAFDGRYRVVAISTPQTIFTDLIGRMPHPRGGYIEFPEAAMLRKARRFYALHPRLMGKSRQAENMRGNWRAEEAG